LVEVIPSGWQDFIRSLNADSSANRPRDGAAIRVHVMNALDGFLHCLWSAEFVVDEDPADDEDVAFQFNFSHRLRNQIAV